jgi:hypothetical protein
MLIIKKGSSFIKILNSNGPSTEHCGTPNFILIIAIRPHKSQSFDNDHVNNEPTRIMHCHLDHNYQVCKVDELGQSYQTLS